MPLLAADWSVVIAGRWNRAILTPAGIGKHLFQLPAGTPVEVSLPLDVIASPQVRHSGIGVIASNASLQVAPEICTYDDLERSREIARRSLRELPRTPVFAVGLNVIFRTDDPLLEITDVMGSMWDDRLSDNGYAIAEHTIKRSLVWNETKINITITADEKSNQSIQFNFDFKSEDVDSQLRWLNIPVEDIEQQISKILIETIKLSERDVAYGKPS